LGGSYPYYATYETADHNLLSVGCTEPWLWENFCRAIGREDLAQYALKPDHFASVADSASLQAKQEVQDIMRQKTRDEWFEYFKDKNVCVGPVYTVEEMFDDPQVQARNMVVNIEDARYGHVWQTGIAIKLSDTPGRIRHTGPSIGEHTGEVLSALGYSGAQRARLYEDGAVA
jgi:crotonobetainyl-CoA:carnitine CoA-transferase CaiB-like acyl-CoA transferase